LPDFQHVATHICDSVKRRLKAEAAEGIQGEFGIGLIILLIWQLDSFRRSVIILITIPLAFTGTLMGVFIVRAPLDFFGILGLLSLAGVIINNGIVLIDRIESERKTCLLIYF